jgi:hypothetical protein
LGYFFSQEKLSINLMKNGLGYTLGDFFTNASGHPVRPALPLSHEMIHSADLTEEAERGKKDTHTSIQT